MPLKDELTLQPWQKWRRYHRFPWKLLIDVITVIIAVTITLLVSSQSSGYTNSCADSFQDIFGQSHERLYSAARFRDHFASLIRNYWNITVATVSKFEHTREDIGPILSLSYYDRLNSYLPSQGYGTGSLNRETRVYVLSSSDPYGPLSPLNGTDISLEFVQKLSVLSLQFWLTSLNVGVFGAVPYSWTIDARYEFEAGGGSCVFVLEARRSLMESDQFSYPIQLSLSGLMMVVSAFSIFLSVRAFVRNLTNYRVVRKRFGNVGQNALSKWKIRSWDDLPFHVKTEFFNKWHLWNFVGNVFLFLASVVSIVFHTSSDVELGMAYDVFQGLGTWFCCCNIVRYLEFNRSLSVLVNTLRLR